MDFQALSEKLNILTASAKYDASCASSGSSSRRGGRVGNTSLGGICHSWSADGRCISLFKILLTNNCVFDCAYCLNRRSNDIPRASFTPRELAELTVNFYRKNYIEGLFLSSGIMQSPDYTMSRMIETSELLRREYSFAGYIHLKIIPGASPELVSRAGLLADRVSVNIELPSQRSLSLLAPEKNFKKIMLPMGKISREIVVRSSEREKSKRAPRYAPAGQSTQLIIGATPETDSDILRLSDFFYRQFRLKRVYYSAYIPVNKERNLPAVSSAPLLREHRLYQADWLLRFYGFSLPELLSGKRRNLEETIDPKASWALEHLEQFPLEINSADYWQLLRVPGVGVRSAGKIVRLRKMKKIAPEDLSRLRLVMKRAGYFLTAGGKRLNSCPLKAEKIRAEMEKSRNNSQKAAQLSLFSENLLAQSFYSAASGEL